MRISETKKHPVMSTSTATKVGVVDRWIIDVPAARVVGLRLKKTEGDGDTLHWGDIAGVGPDAVTVAAADKVTAARDRAAELSDSDFDVVGKRVLTDDGTDLGKVKDVDVDMSSGAVLGLLLDHESIPADRLRGNGSYAVVVRAAATA